VHKVLRTREEKDLTTQKMLTKAKNIIYYTLSIILSITHYLLFYLLLIIIIHNTGYTLLLHTFFMRYLIVMYFSDRISTQ
jgi:hypothetical protein